MSIKNQIMLITYADCMGKNLKELSEILGTYFEGTIGGIHILPFFPSSADRGFAPMTYKKVDPQFGNWDDIKKLSESYYLMFDFMINHISKHSEYFRDFAARKENSPYRDLFLRCKNFWHDGEPSQKDIDLIYKRKPRAPFVDVHFADGTTEQVWCTFDEEQIDLDVRTETTKDFIKENLVNLASHGAAIIRLDAFAYAVKKRGTNCFFVEPEIYNLMDYCKDVLHEQNADILPEIHEHYTMQLKLAEKGYRVYDFALPMLLLNAVYSGNGKNLVNWLKICPRKQFTTLDTHDGIGIVDVKDLMSQEDIDRTVDAMFTKGANVKRIYNTAAYNNLDIYQINCTYYSALGNNDDAYLLSRAVQFFAPGIPQVYYVGLLAGKNDIELLEKTKTGRNINRHYYTKEEIAEEVKRPVLHKLYTLMKFRNTCPAFNGSVHIEDTGKDNLIYITWENGDTKASLHADLHTCLFDIFHTENGVEIKLDLGI